MRDRALILFTLLAAVGALAVAGCGDDDETTATSGATGATGAAGTALTEEEFLAQANEICKVGDQEIVQVGNELFGGQRPSQPELEQFAEDTVIPSIQGQIDAIRALTPPEEIADDVTVFLDDAEAALDEVREDPSSLAAGESAGPFEDVNRQADELGLTECAG